MTDGGYLETTTRTGPQSYLAMNSVSELSRKIAIRLGDIDGVVAVAIGGSWARGDAYPDSDIDIGIYYHPENTPEVVSLRRLAQELDDRNLIEAATQFGAWGPWINGGAWLRIEDRSVDWLYRDLDLVESVIDDCLVGRADCHYQPGHPHGFHNHIYMGEIHYCNPLYDPEDVLARLKSVTTPYPSLLRQTLIDKYLWEAEFALDTSYKSADRGDVAYVTGCLFRSVACLVQVLFALNKRYFVNEKGSVDAVDCFDLRPPRFKQTVTEVLAQPGHVPDALRKSIELISDCTRSVRELREY